jgi:hypothetical protein
MVSQCDVGMSKKNRIIRYSFKVQAEVNVNVTVRLGVQPSPSTPTLATSSVMILLKK